METKGKTIEGNENKLLRHEVSVLRSRLREETRRLEEARAENRALVEDRDRWRAYVGDVNSRTT